MAVLAADDFLMFKNLMVHRNMELEMEVRNAHGEEYVLQLADGLQPSAPHSHEDDDDKLQVRRETHTQSTNERNTPHSHCV